MDTVETKDLKLGVLVRVPNLLPMKIIFWNIRGLNMPHKVKKAADFIFHHRPVVIDILETKIKS